MSEKFTPGPWHMIIILGSYQQPCLIEAAGKAVAKCLGNQLEPDATSIKEARANAHLIAAAPDMFAAANEAFDFLGGVDDAADIRGKLLAAIQKARGGGNG